jgi:hypothetical protein
MPNSPRTIRATVPSSSFGIQLSIHWMITSCCACVGIRNNNKFSQFTYLQVVPIEINCVVKTTVNNSFIKLWVEIYRYILPYLNFPSNRYTLILKEIIIKRKLISDAEDAYNILWLIMEMKVWIQSAFFVINVLHVLKQFKVFSRVFYYAG